MVALTIRASAGPRHLAYREQNSQQTLAEGVAEYYRINGDRVQPPSSLPPESRALFTSHDMCHVIFGLDTTLADEAMADTRTILSCDVGIVHYSKYMTSNAEAKAIFKEIGYGTVLWATVKTLPRMLRAVVELFRVKKKWPWIPLESYMRRSLADLRQEHGIHVI